MFGKMSKRERIMAITVAAMLPVVLAMFAYVYVGGKLTDRADQLSALNDTQRELKLRLAMARCAVNRGQYTKPRVCLPM